MMINWFEHLYPYTNVHELNLDWILGTVKAGEREIKNFIGANVIKYANPIAWDITRQYEGNTVVVDPGTGDAYISVKPVPIGYDLSHIEYWTKIFNFGSTVDTLISQIATNEGNSPTATAARNVGDLVFINGVLYEVTAAIPVNSAYVLNTNIKETTVEQYVRDIVSRIDSDIDSAWTAINGLDSRVTRLETIGNLVMFGDSFLEGGGWGTPLAQFLNPQQSFNFGVSGSGFARPGFSSFHDQLDNAISNMSATEKSQTTIVVVGGGINDQWDVLADLKTAAATFFYDVRSAFPNAKIYWFANWGAYALTMNVRTVFDAIAQECIAKGCTAILDTQYCMLSLGSFFMNADNIHPKAPGYDILAKAVLNGIHGNLYDYADLNSYKAGIVYTRSYRRGSLITYDIQLKPTNDSPLTDGMFIGNNSCGASDTAITYSTQPIFDATGAQAGVITFTTAGIQLWSVTSTTQVCTGSYSFVLNGILE